MTRMKTFTVDNELMDDLYYRPMDDNLKNGYDKVGNLLGYVIVPPQNRAKTTYTNSYALFDGYKEHTVTAVINYESRTTTSHYDANGSISRIVDASNVEYPAERSFITDANGMVLMKTDHRTITRTMIVNGEALGTSNDDEDPYGFANVYQSATSGSNVAAPSIYTVASAGQTPETIAKAVWGDPKLWYLVADANALPDNGPLMVGVVLKIPSRVNTVYNSYGSFKPYDPTEALGGTTPTLPVPAAEKGCGTAGVVLMAIVAIVATIVTTGAALYALGAAPGLGAGIGMAASGAVLTGNGMIAGAIGAAVGSIASQSVGVALDMQEKINWKSVAMSALSSFIVPGGPQLPVNPSLAEVGRSVARHMVANAVSQGIGSLVGINSFSWRGVAAAGVSSFMKAHVGGSTPGFSVGTILQNTLAGFVTGVTATAVTGGKVNFKHVAADAFGNALGSAFANSVSKPSSGPAEQASVSDRKIMSPGEQSFASRRVQYEIDRIFANEDASNIALADAPFPFASPSTSSAPGGKPSGESLSASFAPSTIPGDSKKVAGGLAEPWATQGLITYRDDAGSQVTTWGSRAVHTGQGKLTFAQKLAHDMSRYNLELAQNFIDPRLTLAIGAVEVFVGGAQNAGVRILGGLRSLYYVNDLDEAARQQRSFAADYGYKNRTLGAKWIGDAARPVGLALQRKVMAPARAYSESIIGDGATTYLVGSTQFAFEVATVLTGTRGLASIGDDILFRSAKEAKRASPGPLNLMLDDDQFLINAAKRKDIDPDGEFDLVAHGNTTHIEMNTSKGPVMVDAKTAARHIWEADGYVGQDIRLLSCSTGGCIDGFAQQLANVMNKNVRAPNELLWADVDGRLFVSAGKTVLDPLTGVQQLKPVWPPSGKFIQFTPQR